MFWESFSSFSTQLSQQLSDPSSDLLNPPPWIFTSLAALSQVLLSPSEFSRIGMWRDVSAATAGRFMKAALCSTYTCNELNPPGSFIHSLFQNLSEPLNQITAFTQLRITPDGVSVWHSVILWRGKRKEQTKRKRKESFLYQKWSIPSLHQQIFMLVVLAVVFLNFDPFYSVFYYKDKVKNIWHFWWQLLSFSCHRSLFLSLTSVQTEKFYFSTLPQDGNNAEWTPENKHRFEFSAEMKWQVSCLPSSMVWSRGFMAGVVEEGPKVSSSAWNAALLETCPKSLILD